MIFCLISLGFCKLVPQNHDRPGLDGSSHTSRSCHRHVYDFDAHFSTVEYFVAYFLFIFGSTRVCFGQVWPRIQKPSSCFKETGGHFEICPSKIGYILAFEIFPNTLRQWRDFEYNETCREEEDTEIMHKLII